MKRRGWTRLSDPGAKCDALWEHRSGWRVAHCGHQTAIWPYYAIGPGDEKWAVADSGRGFTTQGMWTVPEDIADLVLEKAAGSLWIQHLLGKGLRLPQ